MFAYCVNNPICLCDSAGTYAQYFLERDDISGSSPYINNQEEDPFASMQLGDYTVSYAGCGAVAAYNALISLGDYTSFSEVLAYFNGAGDRTFANGMFGILPWQVGAYFESLDYSIVYAYTKKDIDNYADSADACILFYMFPRHDTVFGITGTWPGAHFVEFSQVGDAFCGRNTDSLSGVTAFRSPAEFGYGGSNFYAIGIYIYT